MKKINIHLICEAKKYFVEKLIMNAVNDDRNFDDQHTYANIYVNSLERTAYT